MESISLEAAKQAGFEPRSYSPYPRPKETKAFVDFVGEMGKSSTALFFRDESTGERFYAELDLLTPGEDASKTITLVPYLQRNDLCALSVVSGALRFRIQDITLIKQEPLCIWREQCDQRSPCCVFKN